MNRYLIPIQNANEAETVQRVPVDDESVGIYRLGSDSYEVVAEAGGRRFNLGVQDAGVSRKHNGEAPVQLSPAENGIDVENRKSKNPIIVQRSHHQDRLERGEITTISENCVIELGIGVEIRANVRGDDTDLNGGGIEPEEYVRKVGDLTRTCAEKDDVNACHNNLQILYDTITERPIENTAYEEIYEELEQLLNRTESRIKNSMRSAEEFDDEFRAEIERVTERVESIYARN